MQNSRQWPGSQKCDLSFGGAGWAGRGRVHRPQQAHEHGMRQGRAGRPAGQPGCAVAASQARSARPPAPLPQPRSPPRIGWCRACSTCQRRMGCRCRSALFRTYPAGCQGGLNVRAGVNTSSGLVLAVPCNMQPLARHTPAAHRHPRAPPPTTTTHHTAVGRAADLARATVAVFGLRAMPGACQAAGQVGQGVWPAMEKPVQLPVGAQPASWLAHKPDEPSRWLGSQSRARQARLSSPGSACRSSTAC